MEGPFLADFFVTLTVVLSVALVALGWVAIGHRRRAVRMSLLGELSIQVNQAILLDRDGEEAFATILDFSLRLISQVHLGSILALEEGGDLRIVASRGFPDEYRRSFRVPLKESWQWTQTGGVFDEPFVMTPETLEATGVPFDEWTQDYRSVLTAPLRIGDSLYGFLNLDSKKRTSFHPADLKLLKIFQAQIEVCLLARDRYRRTLAASQRDALTGLLNRAAILEQLAEALELARSRETTLVVGLFDVDGLKQVNDRWGHFAGDDLLRNFARVLQKAARKADSVGRLGGDEFLAIYPSGLKILLEERSSRTLQELAMTPTDFGNGRANLSFSYGFASWPEDGTTAQELIERADQRMYSQKRAKPGATAV